MAEFTNYLRAAYYLLAMMRRIYWEQEKLEEYRDRRVRAIVRYAYENVPFYHSLFRKTGIKPSDITCFRHLSRLPVVRKDDLRSNMADVISKKYRCEDLKEVRTSGSTGKPFGIYLAQREDEFRKAKHLRANIAVGQRPRDRWVITAPPHRSEEVTRFQRLFGFFAFTPVSALDDIGSQLDVIERLDPDVLDGFSNSLVFLAKEVEKRGVSPIQPRLIIGGADLISKSSRALVEKVFDAPFFDQYACIELERLAWQCKEKQGYHIDVDSVVMQFVDEEGAEVAPGERGEIVCTSLFNYAMPFLRYAVGDVGVSDEDVDCACGRTLPLMKVVEGRKDSFVLLPDGRVVAPLVFGWIMEFFKFYKYVEHYRIIQKKVDLFKVLVKRRVGDFRDAEFETELLANMRKMLGVGDSVGFDVELVEEIPLDKSGKFMKVVSEIENRSLRAKD